MLHKLEAWIDRAANQIFGADASGRLLIENPLVLTAALLGVLILLTILSKLLFRAPTGSGNDQE